MKKVLVGGAFDVFHYGHLCLLKWAKSLGDHLIVQVISDKRVRYKKGPERPIFPEKERIAIVKAIKYVDEVYFSIYPVRTNPVLRVIKEVKPDIYVRNFEGNKETLEEEKALCKKLGIKIVFHHDFPEDRSKIHTTEIMKKI